VDWVRQNLDLFASPVADAAARLPASDAQALGPLSMHPDFVPPSPETPPPAAHPNIPAPPLLSEHPDLKQRVIPTPQGEMVIELAQQGGPTTARDPNIPPPSEPPVGPTIAQLPASPNSLVADMASVHVSIPRNATVTFTGSKGRTFDVAVDVNGRVAFSAPSPPVQEITFSGGGGKGAALPGAVRALQESHVLDNVKVLNGASVGSMTAALVAAGISAADFAEIGNDPTTGATISEGRSAAGLLVKGIFGSRLSGKGLEDIMRAKIGASVHNQIKKTQDAGVADQQTAGTLNEIDQKILKGGAVTFADLRTLSKIIPDIKELNIAGTYLADDSAHPGRIESKGKPQLAIFNADTEPDLDVAIAVHASAALPPVFDPVNIKLSCGITARFEDGGVMNNAPTSDLVGARRSVDPMPMAGKMTFVFEGEDDVIQKGYAIPERKRLNDFFCAAPNSAAEYAKKRGLAENPQDVVRVPLKFDMPGSNGKPGAQKDFSSLVGGTLNMNMPIDDKIALQGKTEEATNAYIQKRNAPRTTNFSSVNQMLDSVSDEDLTVMASSGFADAQAEQVFRGAVKAGVQALEGIAKDAKATDLQNGPIRAALDELNQLADGDEDRLAYIGRELNRSGRLDPLMTLAKSTGDQGVDALKAGVAVQVALNVQDRVQTVRREMIYPKMVSETSPGLTSALMASVDNVLRMAKTPKQFDDAINALIDHFNSKSDITGLYGHKKFAAELRQYLFEHK
jgi:exoenzyme U